MGAGDAFVAGYLAARLTGADLAGRLDLAVHTGAAACTDPSDWEGAARPEDVERLRRESAGHRVQTVEGEPVDR